MKLDALMLDIDGVLVSSNPDAATSWKAEMIAKGVDVDRLVGEIEGKPWPALLVGFESLHALVKSKLAEQGSPVDVDTFLDFYMRSDFVLDDDLVARVTEWSAMTGVPCYLATNQCSTRETFLWHDVGLSRNFIGIACSSEMHIYKPQPEFFVKAAEKFDLHRPDRIMFFDDMQKNVDAARSVGWNAEICTGRDCVVHWLDAHGTVDVARRQAERTPALPEL